MNKTKLVALVLALIASTAVEAREIRSHYTVLERNRKPAFEVTRIHNDTDSQVTRTYLIADPTGPLLRVDVLNDYPGRKTSYLFTTLRDGKHSGTIELNLPVASTTREGRSEELRGNPALANLPVPVIISSKCGKANGHDSDWRSSNAAAARGRAHAALGTELVRALRNVREIAGLPMFAEINAPLEYIFEDSMIVKKSQKLMVAGGRADCAFDAKFGVPCPE